MHAGQIATLEEVVAHYVAAPEAPGGHSEIRPKNLTEDEQEQLVAFLRSLEPVRDDAMVTSVSVAGAD